MTESTATVAGGVTLSHTVAARRPPRSFKLEIAATSRVAWVALAGLILDSVVTVVCSGSTAVLSPDSLRPLPPGLAGLLSGLGPDIGLAGAIATFTMMMACYLVLVRTGARLPARVIVGAVVAVHVLMALAPPLLSTDVFSYGAYGRMSALYHFNPYILGPTAIRYDPWYDYIGWQWTATPTAYGPLFTAMSYLLAHLSLGASVIAYKLIAVAASLVAIAGTARAAQRLGRDVTHAVLLVGLNPVLIVFAVGGAHNDVIMLAAMVWAIVALIGHRARTAGGLLVAATAVKLTAAIVLPFALAARREPQRRPHYRRMIAGAGFVLVGVGIVSTVLFGSGPLHLLGTLEVIQANGGRQSVPGFIAWGLGLGRLSHGVVIGLEALEVVSVIGLLVAVRRQRLDWITATGWAIVTLLVTSTFLLPWYGVWVLPFAALSSSRSLRIASLMLTTIAMTSL